MISVLAYAGVREYRLNLMNWLEIETLENSFSNASQNPEEGTCAGTRLQHGAA